MVGAAVAAAAVRATCAGGAIRAAARAINTFLRHEVDVRAQALHDGRRAVAAATVVTAIACYQSEYIGTEALATTGMHGPGRDIVSTWR